MGVIRPICVLAAAAAAILWVGPGTAAAANNSHLSSGLAHSDPGSVQWTGLHDGNATSVAASPDGSRVFVTGSTSDDYATVAYDAATGQQLWDSRYDGPTSGRDFAASVAVSP